MHLFGQPYSSGEKANPKEWGGGGNDLNAQYISLCRSDRSSYVYIYFLEIEMKRGPLSESKSPKKVGFTRLKKKNLNAT